MDLLYKTQTRFLFHAHIRIKIPAVFPDTVFDDLYAVLEEIDRKYNSYQRGSYIDLINRHAGSFVEVDEETIRILEQVIFLSGFLAAPMTSPSCRSSACGDFIRMTCGAYRNGMKSRRSAT